MRSKIFLGFCFIALTGCTSQAPIGEDTTVHSGHSSSSSVSVVSSSSIASAQNSPQGWTIYTNAEGKFSLMLPADWTVRTDTFQPALIQFESAERKAASDALKAEYEANTSAWPSWQRIRLPPEIAITSRNSPFDVEEADVNVRTLAIGSTTGTLMLNQTMDDFYYILVEQGGMHYKIALGIDPDDLNTSPYKQILASFRVMQ